MPERLTVVIAYANAVKKWGMVTVTGKLKIAVTATGIFRVQSVLTFISNTEHVIQ